MVSRSSAPGDEMLTGKIINTNFGYIEEGVTHRHLPPDRGVVVAFTPRGDQRDAKHVFEESAIGLLILHDIGMVMQALRQPRQRL